MQHSLKKSEHSDERYRCKTQRLPRFLREYRGEVPGCPGGVGAYATRSGSACRPSSTFLCIQNASIFEEIEFFYSFPNNDLYIFIFIVGKCISKTVRESVCNLGQLSLASLRGRLIEYQLRLG